MLVKLAKKYKTDKVFPHNYMQIYERHFKKFRHKPIHLMEIGIGGYSSPNEGGESLRMWKEYFDKAQIYGIDMFNKEALQEDRIHTFQADQTEHDILQRYIGYAKGMDIIIDDGSHINKHQIGTFKALFPMLNDGGIYVIEDLETSYWPSFGGMFPLIEENSGNTMDYLKDLTDGLNHKNFFDPDFQPSYEDIWIKSIHFYPSIVFIYKGKNKEKCIWKCNTGITLLNPLNEINNNIVINK